MKWLLALCLVSVNSVSCVVLHDPLGSVMQHIALDYHFEKSDPELVMMYLLRAHGCTADARHASELLDRVKLRINQELRACSSGVGVQELVGAVYEVVEQFVCQHGKAPEGKLYGHAIVLTLCLLSTGMLSYFFFNHFNSKQTDDRRAFTGQLNKLSDRVGKERSQVGTVLQAVVQKQNQHESLLKGSLTKVHAEQKQLKQKIEVLSDNDRTLLEQVQKAHEGICSVDEKVDQQDAQVMHALVQLCNGVEQNQEEIAAAARTTHSMYDQMHELSEMMHEQHYEVDEKLHFLKRKQEGLETEAAFNKQYDDLRFNMQEKMRKQQASFEQQQRERHERSMENLFKTLVKSKEDISRLHERTSGLKERVRRQEDKQTSKGFIDATFDTVKGVGEAFSSLGKGAAGMFKVFSGGVPEVNPLYEAQEFVSSFFRKKKQRRRRPAV